MAKGRKRVSFAKSAFQAINDVGAKAGNTTVKKSPHDREWKKFNLIVGFLNDLRLGSHVDQTKKRRQIQSRNRGLIVDRVVRVLAEGCPVERILERTDVLATVRAPRFNLSPSAESDASVVKELRALVLFGVAENDKGENEAATPLNVSRADLCKVFGWDAPTEKEMAEFLAHFPQNESEGESEASAETPAEETAEMVTADKPPVRRRKGNKGKQEKAPVAAE